MKRDEILFKIATVAALFREREMKGTRVRVLHSTFSPPSGSQLSPPLHHRQLPGE